MSFCNATDSDLVRELRQAGVLEEIQPEKIPAEMGTVLIGCADGEQNYDLLNHHWKVCDGHRPCHHTLMLNGGPGLIPEGSVMAKLGERDVLLGHLVGGRMLKEIGTTILMAHWPCGMAGSNGIGLQDYLELCIRAKQDVRLHLESQGESEPQVLLWLHVAYQDRKRTYRANAAAMATWLKSKKIAA